MTTRTDWRKTCAELIEDVRYLIDCVNHDCFDPVVLMECREHLSQARTALAQPEPEGPPKNCWLDDEPDLCPSPCVFDDPSEVINNCVYALQVKCKTECKYYRAELAKHEPVGPGPTDEELLGIEDLEAAWNAQADAFNSWDELGIDEIVFWAQRQALARWGRPAIEPVPVSERPEPEGVDELIQCLRTREHFLTQEGASLVKRGDGIYFGRAADMLTRYTRPTIEPVPVAERPWEREKGWRDPDGECWWCPPDGPPYWQMANPAMVYGGWLLPPHALPVPGAEVGEPSASDIEDYNKRATARFQQMDALERHIDFNQVGWSQTDAGIKWQRLMNEQGADEMRMGL